MSKIETVDNFCTHLTKWRINFVRCNPYHVQIQIAHNFYPTKRKYYNSETSHSEIYPKFKDGNELLQWLSGKMEGVKNKPSEHRFNALDVLEVLNEVSSLEEAKKRFLKLA